MSKSRSHSQGMSMLVPHTATYVTSGLTNWVYELSMSSPPPPPPSILTLLLTNLPNPTQDNLPALSGHFWELQLSITAATPGQSAPPGEGGGLVQLRTRTCVPPPQLRLQSVQGSHGLQLPSTTETCKKKIISTPLGNQ